MSKMSVKQHNWEKIGNKEFVKWSIGQRKIDYILYIQF